MGQDIQYNKYTELRTIGSGAMGMCLFTVKFIQL